VATAVESAQWAELTAPVHRALLAVVAARPMIAALKAAFPAMKATPQPEDALLAIETMGAVCDILERAGDQLERVTATLEAIGIPGSWSTASPPLASPGSSRPTRSRPSSTSGNSPSGRSAKARRSPNSSSAGGAPASGSPPE